MSLSTFPRLLLLPLLLFSVGVWAAPNPVVTLFIDADGDGVVSEGDTLRYTVTINNTGDMTAENLVFTIPLPPHGTPAPPTASPVAPSDQSVNVARGDMVTVTLVASDEDNTPPGTDPIGFVVVAPPSNGTTLITPVNSTTSTLKYTHDGSATNTDEFRVKAVDSSGTPSNETRSKMGQNDRG